MILLSNRRRNIAATKQFVQGLIWLAFKKWGLRVFLYASLPVAHRLGTSGLGGGVFSSCPLTEKVTFNKRLQRGNRVQIPKYVRWGYQLETTQILKATIQVVKLWSVTSQTFLTRPSKDGRITIPNLTMQLMSPNQNLEGQIMQVTLQPI